MIDASIKENEVMGLLPRSAESDSTAQILSGYDDVEEYLRSMPHFNMLTLDEIKHIATQVVSGFFDPGRQIAIQGETELNHIYVMRSGRISIHDEKNIAGSRVGHIEAGEVFGGISLLMNAGISLRSVYVEEKAEVYLIPKELFLDLCTRHSDFFTFFIENFSSHISDASLDSIISSGQAKIFLLSIAPFSFLPEEAVDLVIRAITLVQNKKGTLLFLQGRTRVGHLYILHKGSAESYYEHNDRKTMPEILGEGDMYGGISMLVNNGLAVRTIEIKEDTYFYLLTRDAFLSLCQKYPLFSDFFTDTFGKRMLDKSYAAIIARTSVPHEEAMQLFNLPVQQICSHNMVIGKPDMTIQQVAERMRVENSSYIMFPSQQPDTAGIITESDLTRKVIATDFDIHAAATKVMSLPLFTVDEDAMVFEALMKMMQHNVEHLAVSNSANEIIGVLSNRELIAAQGQSPLILLREISQAQTIHQIAEQYKRMPGIVKALITSGATARNINRMITTVSDAILKKVVALTLKELDPPPTGFAFIIMGSEGRGEQTLRTDQDNAIIFNDVSEAEFPEVSRYFLKLGQLVCERLDIIGFCYCQGDVMAKNPNWCQPLSIWMKYFLKWIYAAEPEDLLQASIFFDFRLGYGDSYLVEALRDHLFGVMGQWTGFLRYMTENALYFKPPLGFFRNFVVASKGEHRDSFNIKLAMTPIVDSARIYALKNGIHATNTLERVQQLYDHDVLSHEEYEELEKAYSFLMQLRIVRQLTACIDQKIPPDNFINPKRMTRIEQTTLKEIFKRIRNFQTKMSFDFLGSA